MAEDIDPSLYIRAPMLDVASGVALSAALLAATPKDASEAIKKCAKKVKKDAAALQEAWTLADAATPVVDRRKVDNRVDNGWGILLDRLEAYAALPVGSFPRAARARELVERISPDRGWLKLPYAAEWAESDKRLKRIEAEGLTADVDALAGKEFLVEVRAAHAEYGVALGMSGPTAQAPEVNLGEPLRALARSIARYSRAVIGDLDDDDEASVARARQALRPLDDFRAGQARRAGAGGATAEPEAEAPAEPAPTAPVK